MRGWRPRRAEGQAQAELVRIDLADGGVTSLCPLAQEWLRGGAGRNLILLDADGSYFAYDPATGARTLIVRAEDASLTTALFRYDAGLPGGRLFLPVRPADRGEDGPGGYTVPGVEAAFSTAIDADAGRLLFRVESVEGQTGGELADGYYVLTGGEAPQPWTLVWRERRGSRPPYIRAATLPDGRYLVITGGAHPPKLPVRRTANLTAPPPATYTLMRPGGLLDRPGHARIKPPKAPPGPQWTGGRLPGEGPVLCAAANLCRGRFYIGPASGNAKRPGRIWNPPLRSNGKCPDPHGWPRRRKAPILEIPMLLKTPQKRPPALPKAGGRPLHFSCGYPARRRWRGAAARNSGRGGSRFPALAQQKSGRYQNDHSFWRWTTRFELVNEGFCRPLPYHLATSPYKPNTGGWAGIGYLWSGRRGSNSLPPPWQGGALPDELRPQNMFSLRREHQRNVVPPIGIEPMTRGFSVPCSTD